MAKQGVKYPFESTDIMWLLQNHKEKKWKVRNRNEFLHKAPILDMAQSPGADLPLKYSILKTPFSALSKAGMWPVLANSQLPLNISFPCCKPLPKEKDEGTQFLILGLTLMLLAQSTGPAASSLTAYLTKTVSKQYSHKCWLPWHKSHKNLEFLRKDNMNDHMQDNSEWDKH